jgi:hypothetical protein
MGPVDQPPGVDDCVDDVERHKEEWFRVAAHLSPPHCWQEGLATDGSIG